MLLQICRIICVIFVHSDVLRPCYSVEEGGGKICGIVCVSVCLFVCLSVLLLCPDESQLKSRGLFLEEKLLRNIM